MRHRDSDSPLNGSGWMARGGSEGRQGDAEDEERKEVTLRVSPDPC